DVPGADDVKAAGTYVGVRNHGQAADLFPAQPLDLERVHPHFGGRVRAGGVVLVDRPRDRLEVLRFGGAHAPIMTEQTGPDPGWVGFPAKAPQIRPAPMRALAICWSRPRRLPRIRGRSWSGWSGPSRGRRCTGRGRSPGRPPCGRRTAT